MLPQLITRRCIRPKRLRTNQKQEPESARITKPSAETCPRSCTQPKLAIRLPRDLLRVEGQSLLRWLYVHHVPPLPARGRLRADLPDSGLTTEIASTLGRFNGFTVCASNRLIKDE